MLSALATCPSLLHLGFAGSGVLKQFGRLVLPVNWGSAQRDLKPEGREVITDIWEKS